jgi:hypothetical protein
MTQNTDKIFLSFLLSYMSAMMQNAVEISSTNFQVTSLLTKTWLASGH